ncbi:MAG: hypothetical protein AAGA17_05710 [Actinomycetota bacterium]
MQIFVATRRTQGEAEHDRWGAVEGELVSFPLCTEGDELGELAMVGVASRGPTTTFEVRELEHLDVDTYRELLLDGWRRVGVPIDDDEPVRSVADVLVDELVRLAGEMPLGTVLGRDGQWLVVRATDETGDRSASHPTQDPGATSDGGW